MYLSDYALKQRMQIIMEKRKSIERLQEQNQKIRSALKYQMSLLSQTSEAVDKVESDGRGQKIQSNQLLFSFFQQKQDQLFNKLVGTLMERQVEWENSKEYAEIVNKYTEKISEFRYSVLDKELGVWENLNKRQTIFSYQNFNPSISHLKKFFIFTVYRNQIEKLLMQRASLLEYITKISDEEWLEETSMEPRFLREQTKYRLIEKLIGKFETESERAQMLEERFRGYAEVFKLLKKQNNELLTKMAKQKPKTRLYCKKKIEYSTAI